MIHNSAKLKRGAFEIAKKQMILISGGITYRGCVSELDQGIRDTCLNDTLGLSCMICENVMGVNGCNNAVSSVVKI